MTARRWFPVLAGEQNLSRVPWEVAEAAYDLYAKRNGTGRTLDEIAEAGGWGITELIELLADVEGDNP